MTRPPTPAAVAIALDLLDDTPAGLAWSNLGDWSTTGDSALDYPTACRQLALRVGRAAALQPGDAVLDLACGHGASLALWPDAFGVRDVSGLELREDCIAHIRRHALTAPSTLPTLPALPTLAALVPGRFDTLPPPAALTARRFDAVLCVDAAYHARSLAAFAALAAALLPPAGRLAFTTLLRPDPAPALSPALDFSLARAGIPAASVLRADTLRATLAAQGFRDIHLTLLDTEVLAGFAAFVQRRRAALPWRRQASPGWLKIQATAWLCHTLYRHRALHYVLVSATRA